MGQPGNGLLANGFLPEAEKAYLQALRLTPGELISVSNLERLYWQQGEVQKAHIFYALQ